MSIDDKIITAIQSLDQQTPDDKDIDFKSLYYRLYNGISDIILNCDKVDIRGEKCYTVIGR